MTLRLADLEAPLEDVEFPNGAVHQPIPFGPTEYKLWREMEKEPDSDKRDEMAMQILRRCYPTATEEDFGCCTVNMLVAMIGHASRKIVQVRDAVKNADAAPAAGTSAPSSPDPASTTLSSQKTSGATSSPKSRARSAKTGGASTTVSPTASPT